MFKISCNTITIALQIKEVPRVRHCTPVELFRGFNQNNYFLLVEVDFFVVVDFFVEVVFLVEVEVVAG